MALAGDGLVGGCGSSSTGSTRLWRQQGRKGACHPSPAAQAAVQHPEAPPLQPCGCRLHLAPCNTASYLRLLQNGLGLLAASGIVAHMHPAGTLLDGEHTSGLPAATLQRRCPCNRRLQPLAELDSSSDSASLRCLPLATEGRYHHSRPASPLRRRPLHSLQDGAAVPIEPDATAG